MGSGSGKAGRIATLCVGMSGGRSAEMGTVSPGLGLEGGGSRLPVRVPCGLYELRNCEKREYGGFFSLEVGTCVFLSVPFL
jgi:hypothetical protein